MPGDRARAMGIYACGYIYIHRDILMDIFRTSEDSWQGKLGTAKGTFGMFYIH